MTLQPLLILGYTASVIFTLHRYDSRLRALKAKDALVALLTKINTECSTFSNQHANIIHPELLSSQIDAAKADLLKTAEELLSGSKSPAQVSLHNPILLPVNVLKTLLHGHLKDFKPQATLLDLASKLDHISGEAIIHAGIVKEAAGSTTVMAGAASALTSMAFLLFFPGGNDQEVVGDQDLKEEEF